jgi:hypothetical protein
VAFLSNDDVCQRLGRRLAERAPELGVRKVSALERFPGGLSFQTFLVVTETGHGPERFVLRRGPDGGVLQPYDSPKPAARNRRKARVCRRCC